MGPQKVRHNWATEHTQTLPFIEYIICTSLNSVGQISLSHLWPLIPHNFWSTDAKADHEVFFLRPTRLTAGTSVSFQKFQASQNNTRHGSDILKCCKKVMWSGSECEVWDLIWLVPHRANFKQGKSGDRWARKMDCLYLPFFSWYVVLKSVFSVTGPVNALEVFIVAGQEGMANTASHRLALLLMAQLSFPSVTWKYVIAIV